MIGPGTAADSIRLLLTPIEGQGPNFRLTGLPAVLVIVAVLGGLATLVWRFVRLRRSAKALALRSEMQYRGLFENSPAGMFMYDTRDQKLLAGNPVLAEMLGCTVDDIKKLRLKDLFPPSVVRETAVKYGSGELMPPQADQLLTRMRRRDGSEFDVDARGRPMDPEKGHSRVVMVIDVTERLAAERASRDSERQARNLSELLRSIIDVAPQAIVATDLDYNITLWNPAAEALFGWTADEVLGKQPPPMVPPEEEDDFHRRFEEIRATGKVKVNDIVRMRKDGARVSLIASGGLRLDASGKPAGFVMVYTDVTQYRGLEAQLRQSQKMEAVGRLAGGVAHDFNNMLTVIFSYTQLLKADFGHNPETAESLRSIEEATSRAAALTRQLLTFSRRQIVNVAPVSLNDLIEQLQPMLRRVTAADINLTTSLDPDLQLVQVDAAQFEQVIVNLAVNAMDAMPEGGRLHVETLNVQLDREFSRAHADVVPGPYVMLTVSDTGTGMDAATMSKIFEPFFTTKQVGQGTGLGLAIAYSAVKQAGGHIWVYSEVGEGTTFKIYLPTLRAPAVRATPTAPMTIVPKGGTVLVAEDDDAVRKSLQSTLERIGYRVLSAENGEVALRFVEEHDAPIDALLTDLMMPGLPGRELAEQVRAIRPSIRVIFMSGYTDDEVLRRQLVDEGQPFLQKPFTREQLVASIEGVIEVA